MQVAFDDLRAQFWQMVPFRKAIPDTGVEWSEELQRKIYHEIIRHPRTVERPPTPFYMFNFLKHLNNVVEESGEAVIEEILEEIVERLASLPKRPEDGGPPPAPCYVTFVVPHLQIPGDLVSVRVSPQLSDIGLSIWTAGLMMFEYIISSKGVFEDRTVFEMGAGVGLTGIALAAKASRPRKIVLSDYAPSALDNMVTNMQINGIEATRVEAQAVPRVGLRDGAVSVVHFDMLKPDRALVDAIAPDVVIAADVLYAPDLAVGVPSAILEFAKRGIPTLLGTAVRNPETFTTFVDKCKELSLSVDDCDVSDRARIFPYDASTVKMLHITLGGTHAG